MIVYPAIDLRAGNVVRLRRGDPDHETIFSDDPVSVAQRWISQGAEWLHVVNLDGAFNRANDNVAILKKIAALEVNVQFGGGLRSLDDMEKALSAGATRVVVGTLAAQNPEVVTEAVERFGSDAVCVAMDARDGLVTTHGWTEKTDLTPIEFGRLMRQKGVEHALYTDVNRDGLMSGIDLLGTVALARNTGLQVIASGGISRMIELQQLAQTGAIAGVIIGTALYKDEIGLKEAILAAKGAT